MINDYNSFKTEDFKNGKPFPHIVIDNLFDNKMLIEMIENYPKDGSLKWWKYDNIFEKKLALNDINALHNSYRLYFNFVNSISFVKHLEKLTGITDLISDPSLHGGGLHRIRRGGKLDIHADFNYHKVTGWRRRLNMITFLNKDWKEEYGGHTELWNKDMTKCIQKVLPIFGRTIIFEVDEDTWHGHPHPLACPENVERRSLATYYYTFHNNTLTDNDYISTNYQKLPDDKADKEVEYLRELRRKGRLKDDTL